MVDILLDGGSIGKLNLTTIMEGMSPEDVVDDVLRVQGGSMPAEVSRVLQQVKLRHTSETAQEPPLDEASIDKARGILNGMIEQAQVELDTETVRCKEFREKNRDTFKQVKSDLSRLGQTIENLDRMKSEAMKDIASTEQQIQLQEEARQKEMLSYKKLRAMDEMEMKQRKNDLAV